MRVGRDEVQIVAEARRTGDEVGTAMEWHRDEKIERDLALVVGDETPAGAVDLAGVELGHQADVLLREEPSERASTRPAS